MKEYIIIYDVSTDNDFKFVAPESNKEIEWYGGGVFVIKANNKKDLFHKLKKSILNGIKDIKNKGIKEIIEKWIDEQEESFMKFGEINWYGNWGSNFFVENW